LIHNRRKKKEGRRKKEEGRRKKEEGEEREEGEEVFCARVLNGKT
jgi:hypothetical protein